MRKISLVVAIIFSSFTSVLAATPQEVANLLRALDLAANIDVMRAEGLEQGRELADNMFTARAGADWDQIVSKIYDQDWMVASIARGMNSTLRDTDVTALLEYFQSDPGRQIIALETSARQAMGDDEVEAASHDALKRLERADDPRLAQISRFVQANDLLERNVVSALNSNFAFFSGLVDGGVMGEGMSEDEILRDVWNQEAEIREEARIWLYSYLAMAYQPLGPADLEDYIAVSQTPAGQMLNSAMFAAFDAMFDEISRSLGRSAALFMMGQDL